MVRGHAQRHLSAGSSMSRMIANFSSSPRMLLTPTRPGSERNVLTNRRLLLQQHSSRRDWRDVLF
jgi:hypothetical protein